MALNTTTAPPRAASAPGAVRMIGRYQLLRLVGKSAQTMVWLAQAPDAEGEVLLALPRVQVASAEAAQPWLARVRRMSRLAHPNLAKLLEVGEHERWPFAAYERGDFVTWQEKLDSKGVPAQELAQWSVQVLQALAFAHEAGAAHRDLQLFSLLVDDAGAVKLLGVEVAEPQGDADAVRDGSGPQSAMDERRLQRQYAEIDVLAFGLLMHQALAGAPALDEPDIARVVGRMPPFGQEIVRLPYTVPRPVPDPLRAIVNRATDRQERQRYRTARTLERALEGWLQASNEQADGPISLLIGRMRSVGLLPAMPGGAERVARLALLERGHNNQLSDIVLQDFALAFELLRSINLAQAQAGNGGSGPVLAMHRAIAMIGLDGVRRAALSLRAWPGPLSEPHAAALERLIQQVKRAGAVARALQPAGYDGEVVTLVTALQNLGWLVAQYHFPEEAMQIRRLMQAVPAGEAGKPDEPGMSAEAASFAVLGVDIDALGTAVMRHWGFDDGVQNMVRRAPPGAAIRNPDSDADFLRLVASCANDVVDAALLPARPALAALQRVVQRYGRPLDLTLKDLQDALQPAGDAGGKAGA
ncbi:MAG TPA: HDOD domain-containing protein [Burkholderiaceae bacterium]|jgi:non-specific serine/threonine protein kinase|nr:HDOD domain-containing protein [Burkholderiaceae bacterium]